MTTIDVINHSTAATDYEVERWCHAVQLQVAAHFAPVWRTGYCVVELRDAPKVKPVPHWIVGIFDDADQAGALGYHTDDKGVPVGKVFAGVDKHYGFDPCITLSHEVLEMLADPFTDRVIQVGQSTFAALEVCDPVEADEYGYPVDIPAWLGGGQEHVSNFVYPAWFNGDPGPWDRRSVLTGPHQLAKGGYMSYWQSGRGWTSETNFDIAMGRHDAHADAGIVGRARRRIEAGNSFAVLGGEA